MTDVAERRLRYQDRCAILAFRESANALAALALGHARSAALHGAAATAWGALAVSVAAAVKSGRVRQETIDALWVESIYPLPPDVFDEDMGSAN